MVEPAATMSVFRQFGLVFLFGGAGASLRVFLVGVIDRRLHQILPFAGTLVVNLIGCLAIGFFSAILPPPWRPIVLGGLLGGFTTYSAFGLLSWDLLEEGRLGAASGQVLIHLIGGLLCVVLGLWLGRMVAGPPKI